MGSMQRTGGNGIFKSASRCAPAADRSHVMRYSVSAGYGAAAGASPASDERRRYTPFMPDDTVRTVYVQQQQVPGGWQDHAETEDRAIANARYKSFAREKGTRRSSEEKGTSLILTPAPRAFYDSLHAPYRPRDRGRNG